MRGFLDEACLTIIWCFLRLVEVSASWNNGSFSMQDRSVFTPNYKWCPFCNQSKDKKCVHWMYSHWFDKGQDCFKHNGKKLWSSNYICSSLWCYQLVCDGTVIPCCSLGDNVFNVLWKKVWGRTSWSDISWWKVMSLSWSVSLQYGSSSILYHRYSWGFFGGGRGITILAPSYIYLVLIVWWVSNSPFIQ